MRNFQITLSMVLIRVIQFCGRRMDQVWRGYVIMACLMGFTISSFGQSTIQEARQLTRFSKLIERNKEQVRELKAKAKTTKENAEAKVDEEFAAGRIDQEKVDDRRSKIVEEYNRTLSDIKKKDFLQAEGRWELAGFMLENKSVGFQPDVGEPIGEEGGGIIIDDAPEDRTSVLVLNEVIQQEIAEEIDWYIKFSKKPFIGGDLNSDLEGFPQSTISISYSSIPITDLSRKSLNGLTIL